MNNTDWAILTGVTGLVLVIGLVALSKVFVL